MSDWSKAANDCLSGIEKCQQGQDISAHVSLLQNWYHNLKTSRHPNADQANRDVDLSSSWLRNEGGKFLEQLGVLERIVSEFRLTQGEVNTSCNAIWEAFIMYDDRINELNNKSAFPESIRLVSLASKAKDTLKIINERFRSGKNSDEHQKALKQHIQNIRVTMKSVPGLQEDASLQTSSDKFNELGTLTRHLAGIVEKQRLIHDKLKELKAILLRNVKPSKKRPHKRESSAQSPSTDKLLENLKNYTNGLESPLPHLIGYLEEAQGKQFFVGIDEEFPEFNKYLHYFNETADEILKSDIKLESQQRSKMVALTGKITEVQECISRRAKEPETGNSLFFQKLELQSYKQLQQLVADFNEVMSKEDPRCSLM